MQESVIMKKKQMDMRVCEVVLFRDRYALLKVRPAEGGLPKILPGQFAQIRVDGSTSTFLRRPISIHMVDEERGEVWFLVQRIGDGTRRLGELKVGDTLNVILPLGRGFTLHNPEDGACLLAGGGVGIAPLLYLGAVMQKMGHRPTFLLGARTADDLLELDQYRRYGDVFVTTEDGSMGEKGFVTQHSILSERRFAHVGVCGPLPMMKAVAAYARRAEVDCEVSLENMMACGLGACLCCVEDTQRGNVCVCKEGPVFNINELKWQI